VGKKGIRPPQFGEKRKRQFGFLAEKKRRRSSTSLSLKRAVTGRPFYSSSWGGGGWGKRKTLPSAPERRGASTSTRIEARTNSYWLPSRRDKGEKKSPPIFSIRRKREGGEHRLLEKKSLLSRSEARGEKVLS